MCKEIVNILPCFLDMKLFDNIMFSCEIGLRKPNIEFYKMALKKFKIAARECIFIDDNIKNLTPFEELGGKVFLFNNKKINDNFIKLNEVISI